MSVNFGQIQRLIGKTVLPITGEKLRVTLRKPADSFFDAQNPQDGPGRTPTEYTANATVIPIKATGRDPGSLSQGMIKVLVDGALEEEPTVGWTVVLNNIEYRINEVSVTRPGATVLLYTLKCGR